MVQLGGQDGQISASTVEFKQTGLLKCVIEGTRVHGVCLWLYKEGGTPMVSVSGP